MNYLEVTSPNQVNTMIDNKIINKQDKENWELINTITIPSESPVTELIINKDSNNQPLSLKKCAILSSGNYSGEVQLNLLFKFSQSNNRFCVFISDIWYNYNYKNAYNELQMINGIYMLKYATNFKYGNNILPLNDTSIYGENFTEIVINCNGTKNFYGTFKLYGVQA